MNFKNKPGVTSTEWEDHGIWLKKTITFDLNTQEGCQAYKAFMDDKLRREIQRGKEIIESRQRLHQELIDKVFDGWKKEEMH